MWVGIHPIDFPLGDRPMAEGIGAALASAEDIGIAAGGFMEVRKT